MPIDLFVFGTLRHVPLLTLIAGRVPNTEPVVARGYRAAPAADGNWPVLVPDESAAAQGLLIRGLDASTLARISHYEDAFGYRPSRIGITAACGTTEALVFRPDQPGDALDGTWSLPDWQRHAVPLAHEAAREIMDVMGRFSGADLRFRRVQIESRAASRLRARSEQPVQKVGQGPGIDTVRLRDRRASHFGYFRTDELTLRYPTFAGGMSPQMMREVFVAPDASIVLPYDPLRDRVLLVEQFRMGPFARGDRRPWMLEPVAGRVDPGETPADCARREAEEEAGIVLRDLVPVGPFYASPGYSAEVFHSFIAICDLPDGSTGTHGVATENEDIRTHVLSFNAAMDLVSSGEARVAPLVLLLLWLARERPNLQASG